jgi:hypothetical protein
MPVSAVDAWSFADLGGDDGHAIPRDPRNIDLDVKHTFQGKLRQYLAGNHIQVLESLEDPRERAGIRVSNYLQSQESKFVG